MPDTSPILALPYILPAQAQKHVTHNEALRLLDAIVQLVVIAADRTEPPAGPAPGDRYVVAPNATGAWAGQDGCIAVADPDGWLFYTPQAGWRAEDLTSGGQIRFDGTVWSGSAVPGDMVEQLGIGTPADATNRLAVASPATLLTHAGADHRLVVNKALPADTASLLFQSGWSGRAEMGLTGAEDFTVKVSADGDSFTEALKLDRHSGAVMAPGNPAFSAYSPGSAWTSILTPNTDLVFNTPTLNRGGHYDPATSLFTAPVAGVYTFLINGILGATTDGRVSFSRNGITQTGQMQILLGAAPLSFSMVMALNPGDTVGCRTGNINATFRYHPNHTAFSGWLLS